MATNKAGCGSTSARGRSFLELQLTSSRFFVLATSPLSHDAANGGSSTTRPLWPMNGVVARFPGLRRTPAPPAPLTMTAARLVRAVALARAAPAARPQPSRARPFSGSSRGLLPTSFAAPLPTYFQRKTSLPRNTGVRFVPQQTAWIVERMGKFNRILEPGLAILIPFIDRIAYVKSLKEVAIEIPSQSAITADNVTLELDGVLYTRVFDAFKARWAWMTTNTAWHPLALTLRAGQLRR